MGREYNDGTSDIGNQLRDFIYQKKALIELKEEISLLKEEIGKKYEFRNIIKGNSPAIQQIFKLIDNALARIYNNSGSAQGAQFLVNTVTANEQSDATVAGLVDGGFVNV